MVAPVFPRIRGRAARAVAALFFVDGGKGKADHLPEFKDGFMSKDPRDSIVAKIKALLAKTVENGATEQEALAAAAKAAELMARHDLDMDDLGLLDVEVVRESRDLDPDVARHFPKVSAAIADLCEVRRWTVAGDLEEEFLGLSHDVEVAVYLARICERAMVNALRKQAACWALFRPNKRSRMRDSFVEGMADRLADRISDIAWHRRNRTTGTALVPVKDAKIDEAMDRMGITLYNTRIGKRDRDLAAFLHGVGEAEKVQLEAGIKTGGEDEALEDQGLR